MQFVLFPNGKVWRVSADGQIKGSVLVPGYEGVGDLDERLDAIAEAVTGSIIGLCDFSYVPRGQDIVSFAGSADEFIASDERFKVLDTDAPELKAALIAQYGLMGVEADHALDSLGDQYGSECVIDVLGSHRQIRCPAHPEPCSYVRVVADGLELAYWVDDEWRNAPAEVLGALLGAARGGSAGN